MMEPNSPSPSRKMISRVPRLPLKVDTTRPAVAAQGYAEYVRRPRSSLKSRPSAESIITV